MSDRFFELATSIDPRHTELSAAGGLATALCVRLEALGSDIRPSALPRGHNTPVLARASRRGRYAQALLARRREIYVTEFWQEGVLLAEGHLRDLGELASAFGAWFRDDGEVRCTPRALVEISGDIWYTDKAEAYLEGPEAYVRWQHGNLRAVLAASDDAARGSLLSAIVEHPALAKLFPYCIESRLMLSDCTGFPYRLGFPAAFPWVGDRYWVEDPTGETVGVGNVERCVEWLAASLPKGCGAARHGVGRPIWDEPLLAASCGDCGESHSP